MRAAARKFNYQPSLLARSLRKQRTFTVGVLVPELSDGYHTLVMSGIGDHLMREGYFYFSAQHRHKADMIEEYPRLFVGGGAEGIIAIDTALHHELPIPVVAVAGHRKIAGVTNVVLDHRRAAELSLGHLHQLGHRHIAFMRGQSFSSDSDDRWRSLRGSSQGTWDRNSSRADDSVGARSDFSGTWLSGGPGITAKPARVHEAIVSFNDIAAIGAIRALRDANLRVPEDVSIIGFDDIQVAAYHNPRLTSHPATASRYGEPQRASFCKGYRFKDYP